MEVAYIIASVVALLIVAGTSIYLSAQSARDRRDVVATWREIHVRDSTEIEALRNRLMSTDFQQWAAAQNEVATPPDRVRPSLTDWPPRAWSDGEQPNERDLADQLSETLRSSGQDYEPSADDFDGRPVIG